MTTVIGAGGLMVSAHVASYGLWRRWCLTWGAMTSEAETVLPGDDLLPEPDIVTTRAIGIKAPVDLVWPWLVQMGPGRAGAYTYDWIENILGLNMHSADAIIPELQHLSPDDAWRLGSRGPVLRVRHLEPEHNLVLRSDDGNWVWAFVLEPYGSTTRLISRNRIAMPGAPWLSRAITRYMMEPGSLIMERKMLLGIKARAERLASAAWLACADDRARRVRARIPVSCAAARREHMERAEPRHRLGQRPLSPTGEHEAWHAGRLLAARELRPAFAHTSLQRRAIQTADLALAGCDRDWVPVRRSWRLKSNHFGALQGRDKDEVRAEYGDRQYHAWRREYDCAPPRQPARLGRMPVDGPARAGRLAR